MQFILITLFLMIGFSFSSLAMNNDEDDLIKGLGVGKGLDGLKTPKKSNPTKNPQTEPKKERSYEFDVTLHRYQNKAQACTYFSKLANLSCSGVSISSSNNNSIFGVDSSLENMDEFLRVQVEKYGKSGWNRNHLATDLFVVVNDTTQDEKKCIVGSLLVDVIDEDVFEFSVSPSNLHLNGRKKANFMSSAETDQGINQTISQKGYVPIDQDKLRPVFDNDNHGDRLALDTISSNVDMFFSLVRKSAHRSDLSILGMGVQYYSSYDACNPCFEKIYNNRNSLSEKVNQFAKIGGYKVSQEKPIPVYSLFYSTRPYKESTYSISWENPEDQKKYKKEITHSYKFPQNKGIVTCPDYHFVYPKFQNESNNKCFIKRTSKQINLLNIPTELNTEQVYSYVKCFEPEGLPIQYK